MTHRSRFTIRRMATTTFRSVRLLASLLSLCTGASCAGPGRTVHLTSSPSSDSDWVKAVYPDIIAGWMVSAAAFNPSLSNGEGCMSFANWTGSGEPSCHEGSFVRQRRIHRYPWTLCPSLPGALVGARPAPNIRSAPRRRTHRTHERTMSSWTAAVYGLLGLTLLNLLFVAHFLRTLEGILPTSTPYSYAGDDFPTNLPLPLAPVGLVLADGAPHFALAADAEWETIFPANDGFTALGPANRTFLVAVVHQMHCLDVLRVGFAMRGRAEHAGHVQHCLRYLRQALLCHADTALEPAVPVRNGRGEWVHAADGEGTVRRCRDWTALRRYLEAHPAGPLEIPTGVEA
ncbi:hypothetical protein VTO73DRAFT_10855 [Trametes versicolor]